MVAPTSVTLEVPDPTNAKVFYAAAFDVSRHVGVRSAGSSTTDAPPFTLSLVVPQPSTVDTFVHDALGAGATSLKPVEKSFWGYGGVVRAPDGAIWKIASSSKRDTGPATRQIDDVVLLLGVEDVKASKKFYVERGLTVKRSFGGKYAEFNAPASQLTLALYPRKALAKDAGVPLDRIASPRIVIAGDAGTFSDPDGFAWERT